MTKPEAILGEERFTMHCSPSCQGKHDDGRCSWLCTGAWAACSHARRPGCVATADNTAGLWTSRSTPVTYFTIQVPPPRCFTASLNSTIGWGQMFNARTYGGYFPSKLKQEFWHSTEHVYSQIFPQKAFHYHLLWHNPSIIIDLMRDDTFSFRIMYSLKLLNQQLICLPLLPAWKPQGTFKNITFYLWNSDLNATTLPDG